MKITKVHLFTNQINSMELDICPQMYEKFEKGKLKVQDAFPHLSADEREFLITGLLPGDWELYLGDPE